ncbi:polysaccharide deacetylase family protein [Aporhodopirellula aestuarii]|uniref:Polysaccharide deacetylase family protein n=1 Tax=Aporhodopirellula aestuarii TaxID=2950107 RepID=A0ABT0TY57_9BACT|nr:polysaccharide deacetylase family protein [Aporhodopirellula aestuarii]MCM2369526.1 polysaccharide deacetylase family protein [Aporhodopirellula aestuarii]
MNFLRTLALGTRYTLSRHRRSKRMRDLAAANQAPISVLFYHRVADCHPNDWTISTDQFIRHVEYCREHYEIISLGEAQKRLQENCSPRPAVCITFDDGYAENMQSAIPWLIRNRIPCTYFVATEHVRHGRPFAHDVEAGCPLATNTIEQLRAAAKGGIEIGLHTANHVDFNTITTYQELESEIVDAKMDLEMMIGEPIDYFAVPFGMPEQMRPAVFEVARRCGIRGVCSAFGAYNLVGDDPFHIRRIHGDPDFIRLRNWLSFDERKLRYMPSLPTEDILVEQNLSERQDEADVVSSAGAVALANGDSLFVDSSLLQQPTIHA